jgi:hypothetical protein
MRGLFRWEDALLGGLLRRGDTLAPTVRTGPMTLMGTEGASHKRQVLPPGA